MCVYVEGKQMESPIFKIWTHKFKKAFYMIGYLTQKHNCYKTIITI